LETNKTYVNLNPKGEPRLGTRGLYSNIGGVDRQAQEMALLWVLNLSDGQHSLLDIAERSDLKYTLIKDAADALTGVGLLKEHM
jgi:aminopeptidase-like protein